MAKMPQAEGRGEREEGREQTLSPHFEIPAAIADLGVPHLADYFGVWSILEDPFRAAVARFSGVDLHAHVQAQAAQARSLDLSYSVTDDGVALFELDGLMMKHASSFSGTASTTALRHQLRNGARDDKVQKGLLKIDSPGGTVAGTKDLADDVAAFAKVKPIVAYIEDLGASAAYWVASQTTKIYANATALVGSIGTYAVICDYSAQAAMIGVKVHVVRSAQFKGEGVEGTEVTAAHLAEAQDRIDALNEFFVQGVSIGRKMAIGKVREIADGRVHVGEKARAIGLIDGVRSLDDVFVELQSIGKPRQSQTRVSLSTKERKTMSTVTDDPQATEQTPATPKAATPPPLPAAASYADIVAACPGADAAFICAQQAASATVDQARKGWMTAQQDQNVALKKDLESARAQAAKPGVTPLGTGDGKNTLSAAAGGGDATDRWNQAVAEKVAAGKTQAQAIAAVVAEDPDLQDAYIAEHNAKHGRTRR